MTIRQMRASDLPHYGELCRYCFTGMLVQGPHQYMTWVGKHIAHTWAAFEGRTMLAGMWYYPYEMRVGDDFLPMGGVAAVATAPEARNRGHVKTLMTKAHQQMRDEGRPLAVLMPFKGSFYARMGYADTFFHHTFEFTPGQLASCGRTRASLRAVDGVKIWRTIEDLHQRCGAHRCGTVKRDATYLKWRWLRSAKGLRKVYLVERGEEPVGFVVATLQTANQTETPNFHINHAVWTDADALRAVLSFIRAHRDQVSKVLWSLPVDVDLFPFFADDHVKVERHQKMMLKLVDMKGAIERRSYAPELSDELVLEVTADDTSPWNGGRWRVSWDNGQAEVKKLQRPAAGVPRVQCDTQTLAIMYAGHRSASSLASDGLLTVSEKAGAILDRAFPSGSPFMQEWF